MIDASAGPFDNGRGSGISLEDSPTETRYRAAKVDMTRRPHSTYPDSSDEPVYHPHRKYTDPTPHTAQYPMHEPASPILSASGHHLDVDLDVYSQDYEVEDDVRQPTLSFVTTSTADSTTSSPSISEAYTYGTERIEGKPEQHEPRIRVRTNLGRQNAYSSAESSMASGAYSYHAYSDNSYHGPPPPLPTASSSDVGLGISRSSQYSRASPDDRSALQPHAPYGHPDWHDSMTRDRSNSTSSALSSESTSSTDDRLSTSFQHTFSYLSDSLPGQRYPWGDEINAVPESNAVAMVGDGRSIILDREKLESMGGIRALRKMSETEILRLPRFTHLLLSSVGPGVLDILPALLDVLSTTLVVLDVSNNDLTSLPAELRHCTALEELNVSGNPLRQLSPMLGECMTLHVLVADNCMLGNLPAELSQLSNLHTLCIRSNRLVALPPWLCLLGQLETLRIDNNPFAPQWVPIVAPILASTLNQHQHQLRNQASQQSMRSLVAGTTTNRTTPASSVASSIHQVSISPVTQTTITPFSPSAYSSSFASESTTSLGSASRAPADSRPTTPGPVHSLRTTRPIGGNGSAGTLSKRSETPLPTNARAPNRSVTGPAPSSEHFNIERSVQGQRRVKSAVGHNYQTDDSDHETQDPKGGKWGFLRKVSMSRLRSEKTQQAKLTAAAAANVAQMPSIAHTISSPISNVPRRPPLSAAGWSSSNIPTRREATALTPTLSSTSLPQSITVPLNGYPSGPSAARNKRRSFLPIDPSPPSLNVAIPATSPFMAATASLADVDQPHIHDEDAVETLGDEGDEVSPRARAPSAMSMAPSEAGFSIIDQDGCYARGLESIKSYLRDLHDLGLPATEPYGGFEVIDTTDAASPQSETAALRSSMAESSRSSRHAHESRGISIFSNGGDDLRPDASAMPSPPGVSPGSGKRYKDDKNKRARVIKEILDTEKTYVRGLSELITIYVRPAMQPVNSSKSAETVIPAAERKIVFGGVESVLVIHRDNFLPALERAIKPLVDHGDDEKGELSARVAHQVGEVFRTYIAYMKQYSTYINNFDNALQRMKSWTMQVADRMGPGGASKGIGVAAVGAGLVGSAVLPVGDAVPITSCPLSVTQRKRVKHFLKRCKEHPQHSQINLESYLLLPVQRVPRYKLLLEDLAMCTPPRDVIGPSDALDDAINDITTLASLMNEEKRESESRLRLLHWQQRITSRGPSPLVQPHRKLILDGALTLIRVVKKASAFVEVDTQMSLVGADGDSTITGSKAVVPVEYIKAEPMDKPIMLILCSDMLVLVQKRTGEGWDGQVDLFTVMRMATLREPASVSASNDRVLRIVDNKVSNTIFGRGHGADTLSRSTTSTADLTARHCSGAAPSTDRTATEHRPAPAFHPASLIIIHQYPFSRTLIISIQTRTKNHDKNRQAHYTNISHFLLFLSSGYIFLVSYLSQALLFAGGSRSVGDAFVVTTTIQSMHLAGTKRRNLRWCPAEMLATPEPN